MSLFRSAEREPGNNYTVGSGSVTSRKRRISQPTTTSPRFSTHIYITPEHLNTSHPHQPLLASMSDAKALSLDEMISQSKLFCVISRVFANCLLTLSLLDRRAKASEIASATMGKHRNQIVPTGPANLNGRGGINKVRPSTTRNHVIILHILPPPLLHLTHERVRRCFDYLVIVTEI